LIEERHRVVARAWGVPDASRSHEETVMKEQVPPDSDAADDKAVIQNQDVEHQPMPGTRVPNTGVKVPPPALDRPDRRDLEKEENEAQKSVEELEQSVRNQIPG
jgi:hypothetical protein